MAHPSTLAVAPPAARPQRPVSGKPDLVALAHRACEDFDAEAVFVVSDKATTIRVVNELERRGVPAFGPIWDS